MNKGDKVVVATEMNVYIGTFDGWDEDNEWIHILEVIEYKLSISMSPVGPPQQGHSLQPVDFTRGLLPEMWIRPTRYYSFENVDEEMKEQFEQTMTELRARQAGVTPAQSGIIIPGLKR